MFIEINFLPNHDFVLKWIPRYRPIYLVIVVQHYFRFKNEAKLTAAQRHETTSCIRGFTSAIQFAIVFPRDAASRPNTFCITS